MNDITLIYYTANHIPEGFMKRIQEQIIKAADGAKIISVSQKTIDFGENICIGDIGRSAYNIYKQVLIGAKAAKTEFVATCEDDILYPPEHFKYRPDGDIFAYDTNRWRIYSWVKPPFLSYSERRNMTSLIVRREALVKTLEERFERWPDPNNYPKNYWGEPGRFENHLHITGLINERYHSEVPSVVFCLEESLAFLNLGKKKAHSSERTFEVKPWGSAEEILKIYTG